MLCPLSPLRTPGHQSHGVERELRSSRTMRSYEVNAASPGHDISSTLAEVLRCWPFSQVEHIPSQLLMILVGLLPASVHDSSCPFALLSSRVKLRLKVTYVTFSVIGTR